MRKDGYILSNNLINNLIGGDGFITEYIKQFYYWTVEPPNIEAKHLHLFINFTNA